MVSATAMMTIAPVTICWVNGLTPSTVKPLVNMVTVSYTHLDVYKRQSLSKSLALQYAPQVRVNSVCPGPILTPFWSAPGGFLESIERQYSRSGDEALAAFIEDRHIPMGRMGTADDVARAIVYLASPASSFITGGVLGVDGGTVRALA